MDGLVRANDSLHPLLCHQKGFRTSNNAQTHTVLAMLSSFSLTRVLLVIQWKEQKGLREELCLEIHKHPALQ